MDWEVHQEAPQPKPVAACFLCWREVHLQEGSSPLRVLILRSFRREAMSHNKMDMKLNLTPPAATGGPSYYQRSSSSSSLSSSSPPSSCVSSETEQGMKGPNSPEVTSMVLAACPRCFMYVMLAGEEPKCPKCHRAVILDFLQEKNTTTKKTRKS